MDLGIKLVLDKESVEQAKKILGESFQIDTTQVSKENVSVTPKEKVGESKKDIGMSAAIGGAIGGALGGIFGELISYIRPIKDILAAVGAVITVGLSPILPVLRMFFIAFLSIFLKIKKFFMMDWGAITKENIKSLQEGAGVNTGEKVAGSAGAGVDKLKSIFQDWFQNLFDSWQPMTWLDGLFKGSIEVFVAGFMNVIWGVVDIFAGIWDFFVGLFTGNWKLMWQGVLEVVGGIIEIFVGVIQFVVGAVMTIFSGILVFIKSWWDWLFTGFKKAWELLSTFGKWLWDGITGSFQGAVDKLKEFGQWMWDSLTKVFSDAFSVLRGIGSWIWDTITSFFSGGGGSSSHDDVLITKTGEVHDFNPNDNLIAVQDLGTLGKMGGSGQAITINVQGFVGDETELAYKVSKALQNYSRGSGTQW